MTPIRIAEWAELNDRQPSGALAGNTDLVVIKYDERVSVLYGRCLHRGALLADGSVVGDDIVCGLHGWDYRVETGVSAYDNTEVLEQFTSWVEDGGVYIDAEEVAAFEEREPQPWKRDSYQGAYQDPQGTTAEPHVKLIRRLAGEGLAGVGSHGPMAAMGVHRDELPSWDDIQILTAQLARPPLLDDVEVATELIVGPDSKLPLRLDIPIIVSDMSFGALSFEAKVSLAKGAEAAGTGICSGEGGMLADEQEANSRYFYELASGRFGFSWDKVQKVQAFHFKGGQGAKTGTGGHLPGSKVMGLIAETRELPEGESAVSPARFPDWTTPAEIGEFATEVRERTGGIPIGYKLSAQRIEDDLDAAFEVGVDYIILDGRGGGTGAAPQLFRDNISVPTIPALARARRHLDRSGKSGSVTLFITGGLRTPADFVKALALGADGVAISNSALQAIGCLGMRACNTNNCPVGIATQLPHLRDRLPVDEAAMRLDRFLRSSVDLMKVLARAMGHASLADLEPTDLTTFKRDMADLAGVSYGGFAGRPMS